MEITLETVAAKIRERREVVRQSLLSIDDEDVPTYQIEITTDNSRQKPLPPRFSWSGKEEYLAEFDLVSAEESVEDAKESNQPGSVHGKQSMPVEKDKKANNAMKKDSVNVKSTPFTENKELKESIQPVSVDVKSTPFTENKDLKESIQHIARFSPFRKKKQEKKTIQPEIVTTSSYDSVEVSVEQVEPVEPVGRCSPFRRKKQVKVTVKPERLKTKSSLITKRSGVTYLKASIEPATKSTLVKESSVVSAVSIEPDTKSTPVRGTMSPSATKRSGVMYLQATVEPATKSTPVKERSVVSAASIEPDTKSTPVKGTRSPPATKRSGVTYLQASVESATKSTPVKERSAVSAASIEPDTKATPVRKTEDVKESVQPEAKSTQVKTQVTVDIGNVSTPVKKEKEDDDTKSLTTASSDSDRVPHTKSPPTAVQNKNGVEQNVAGGSSLFERYLEKVLDKVCGSCDGIPAPQRCVPLLEEDEEMQFSVENVLAGKFQRSKKKAQERKAAKKADKQKPEKKASKKKSKETIMVPRVFASEAKNKPSPMEWGMRPSEDESERGIKPSENESEHVFESRKGFTVGQFLQTKVSRLTKGKYAGEKEVDAKVVEEEEEGCRSAREERSSAGGAILSVTPLRLNKKREIVGSRSGARSDKHNRDGPDENEDSDSLFDDVDDNSLSDSDSDSEYTTEVVQVDFDPTKLADTMDADKYLAREVLRRYAEMTGVSLDELIEDVVDESLASMTLDSFPTMRN